MVTVIKPRNWIAVELRKQAEPDKTPVMARLLQQSEAPQWIITRVGETLVAQTGVMMCYEPGHRVCPTLDDYEHWPVEWEIFRVTYRALDAWDWQPSPPEEHLMRFGCEPYYRVARD
jgi:hypothetical protein